MNALVIGRPASTSFKRRHHNRYAFNVNALPSMSFNSFTRAVSWAITEWSDSMYSLRMSAAWAPGASLNAVCFTVIIRPFLCSLLFSMITYDSLRHAMLVSFHWTCPIHYHVNPIPDLNDDEWYQEIPHHWCHGCLSMNHADYHMSTAYDFRDEHNDCNESINDDSDEKHWLLFPQWWFPIIMFRCHHVFIIDACRMIIQCVHVINNSMIFNMLLFEIVLHCFLDMFSTAWKFMRYCHLFSMFTLFPLLTSSSRLKPGGGIPCEPYIGLPNQDSHDYRIILIILVSLQRTCLNHD